MPDFRLCGIQAKLQFDPLHLGLEYVAAMRLADVPIAQPNTISITLGSGFEIERTSMCITKLAGCDVGQSKMRKMNAARDGPNR